MANSHGIDEKCDICNKLHVNKEALERHKKKVHLAMQGMDLDTFGMELHRVEKYWKIAK